MLQVYLRGQNLLAYVDQARLIDSVLFLGSTSTAGLYYLDMNIQTGSPPKVQPSLKFELEFKLLGCQAVAGQRFKSRWYVHKADFSDFWAGC